MTSVEYINDPTKAMSAALILFGKAFQLTTPTNNNQRTSSNPRNRQIAQPVMNKSQDRQTQNNGLVVVPRIANQSGTDNVVAARAEGTGIGNQARCYNCRGLGHIARNCTARPRRMDAAYLQTQLLIAQKEEAEIQLQAEEFDFMAAAGNLDEIEEVNANCILMANLQQASTSGTQHDKAPIYDTDGSAEVQLNDNCYDNEIFNMFTQEEQYTDLLEPIPEPQLVSQNDNHVTSVAPSMVQSGGTVETSFALNEETRTHQETVYRNLVDQVAQKMALGYPKISYLKKAQLKQQSLYNGNLLLEEYDPPAVYDSKEILKLAQETKFVRDFKSLAKEADESLDKQKSLELEIERLLKASVSHDIMSIVQNGFIDVPSNLKTKLDRTKEKLKLCIIKKEKEYVVLWNNWYTKCEECKYDKISYDKAYNDMQQKVERLQAQLRDLKGKSNDTPSASNTLDPLNPKLESKIVELEFQLRARVFENTSESMKNTSGMNVTPYVNKPKLSAVTPLSKKLHASMPSHSVPQPKEFNVMKYRNVISPKMFKINPSQTPRVDLVPNKQSSASSRTNAITYSQRHVIVKENVSSNKVTASSIGLVHTAKTKSLQPKGNTRNARVLFASKSSEVKKNVTVEEHRRNLLLSKNQKTMSSKCNNIKLAILNDKSKTVYGTCKQCLVTTNHDACLLSSVNALNSRANKLCANVPLSANQKRHRTQVWKPKQVGSKERLACKPRLPRLSLKWSPSGRSLDLKGKLVASKVTNCPNDDKACTSNPQEPMRNGFQIQLYFLAGTVRFGNDHIAAILGYDDLKWGNITITRVYFVEGKSKRASHPPKPISNSKQRLHLLYMDLCGPMRVASINGKQYVLAIVDDYSRYTWVHFLRTKDETPEVIKNFLKKIYVRLQAPVIIVRTDNGTKFKNHFLKEYFDSAGITHETSAAKTPQQIRVVERKNRTLVEAARTMLIFSRALLFLWAENDHEDNGKLGAKSSRPGLQSMTSGQISSELELTYVLSTITPQRPSERDLDILFEPLHNEYLGGRSSTVPRTIPVVPVVQNLQAPTASMSFQDSVPVSTNSSNTLVSSHNVDGPSQQHAQQQRNLTQSPTASAAENVLNVVFEGDLFVNPFATPSTESVVSSTQYVDPSNMHTFYQPYVHDYQWTKDHPLEQVIGEPSRPVLTRNQLKTDGDMCIYALTVSIMEPKSIKEALTDPAWIESMKEELHQFIRLDVWELVPSPDGIKPLTLKWLFKNKHDEEKSCSDGSYQDILGIRCTQRIHSVSNGHESFISAWFIERRRALYGLKQAPRAWYNELSTFLLQNGFSKGTIDPTLFTRCFDEDILVVQVYVDDIIFGSSDPRYATLLSDLMKSRFEMSMMGEMMFFLSLRVNQSPSGIFINQSKYVHEILKKYGLNTCNIVGTPMDIKHKLDLDHIGTSFDATKYHSMIGALMYLTSSRPGIVHDTCVCARYQAHPTEKHLKEVKGSFVIFEEPLLWVSDTFKSTYDGAQFLGEKLMSWSSKKQDCTSLSTAESEYVSLSACCAQNWRDLPKDTPIDRLEVLRYDTGKRSKVRMGIMPTETELTLEQTQQVTMEILLEPTSSKLLVGDVGDSIWIELVTLDINLDVKVDADAELSEIIVSKVPEHMSANNKSEHELKIFNFTM
nr:hypothetical protein [Tanacetum cinerariifolium]